MCVQTVTRAEMTIDKENGWSKGFGFVSFSMVEEADAALHAVHGSWMAGREMKVEKTHECAHTPRIQPSPHRRCTLRSR